MARLLVVRGPQAGRRVGIEGSLLVGRSHEVQLQIDDGEISRRHARIFYDPEHGFMVEDLASRNGTHVRGVAITRAPIAFGEEITLGSQVVLRLVQRDAGEDQALEQQRLVAVGRLAAGIAHDVGNMMGAVASNVDFLRALPPGSVLGDAEIRESLADIFLAATRASDLMRSIIGFARGHGRGREIVDLSALASEVLRLLRHVLGRGVNVETDIEPGVMVLGDRCELHQVVMNLCLNARDAMPDGGTLGVTVTMVAASGRALDSGALEASLVVRDTGIGMSAATQARIFEPFFSTKGEGLGFGLGLATVRDVVRAHGGVVKVESTLGRGSTFQVILPARLGHPREAWVAATLEGDAAKEQIAGMEGAVILVADDEAVVQRSMARLLRHAGFEVVLASSGREAVERYSSLPQAPSLVLLDLDMPGWSGEETLEALVARDHSARVVIMSGDPDRASLVRGAVGTIEKPCDARTLIESVRNGMVVKLTEGTTRER
ncbi:MAG: response regulator [Polyangiaceae bacterium]|nr:response regulator [Polyangiaceae bacterium]